MFIQACYLSNETTHRVLLPGQEVYVTMPVAGKVTAAALQAFIAQKLGVSPDQISLECGTYREECNLITNVRKCTPIARSSYPVGDEEVPLPATNESYSENIATITQRFVNFCVKRCAEYPE